MNIVVVMMDTFRGDCLGFLGERPAKTPNIDRFARKATTFVRSYCASWPTIPNRLDLLTGLTGDPFNGWTPLPWDVDTFPKRLWDVGYATQLVHDTPHLINFGYGYDRPFHAWHMVRGAEVDRWNAGTEMAEINCEPEKLAPYIRETYLAQYLRNRSRYRGEKDEQCAKVFRAAGEFLDQLKGHEKFLLWVDCFDPHEPWDPPQRFIEMYDAEYQGDDLLFYPDFDQVTAAEIERVRTLYMAKATMVDHYLGRFLRKVRRLGLEKDTAVVLLSDHGAYVGDRGWTYKRPPLYEEITRVVTMACLPDGTGAGMKSDALIQPHDITATLLELAGAEPLSGLAGTSVLPLMRGEGEGREMVLTGMRPGAYGASEITVTTPRWTLIVSPKSPEKELYDLERDPRQTRNVAGDHPSIVRDLHGALLEELRRRTTPPEVVGWLERGEITRTVAGPSELTGLDRWMDTTRLRPENFLRATPRKRV